MVAHSVRVLHYQLSDSGRRGGWESWAAVRGREGWFGKTSERAWGLLSEGGQHVLIQGHRHPYLSALCLSKWSPMLPAGEVCRG